MNFTTFYIHIITKGGGGEVPDGDAEPGKEREDDEEVRGDHLSKGRDVSN